jgi:hypothetical protein
VKHDRVTVSIFRRYQIEEETEWIEHRCLNICHERYTRKKIRVPKGQRPVRPHLFMQEFLPGVKLENEIRTEKRFSGKDNLGKEQEDSKDKDRKGNKVGQKASMT